MKDNRSVEEKLRMNSYLRDNGEALKEVLFFEQFGKQVSKAAHCSEQKEKSGPTLEELAKLAATSDISEFVVGEIGFSSQDSFPQEDEPGEEKGM